MNIARYLFVELWPWWLGGIAIGLLVPLMYYFLNTALGVSTGYGNLLKILLQKTKLRWLNTDAFKNKFNWRFIFIVGIIIGGFVSARTSGNNITTSQMGIFTEKTDWPLAVQLVWFFAGGILLGLGARLANGCTSGHSIHGLATFQKSSIIATAMFLLFGVIATWLIRIAIFGGG